MHRHAGTVQTDIAKTGGGAIDPLDMQAVDHQTLQPLQPQRITAIRRVFDVQLADHAASPLTRQTEPALGRISRAPVDIQVQPDRPGAGLAANVHRPEAVAHNLDRAKGDREVGIAIIADASAHIVKHHLVQHRSALQDLRQAPAIQTHTLILRLGAGQRVIADLHGPDARRPARCHHRRTNRDQGRDALNPRARRTPVIVTDQRGIVPTHGRGHTVIAARQIDCRGIGQRGHKGGLHVGGAGRHVLRPMVGIGQPHRHPTRHIGDRSAGACIAVGVARRDDDRARRRRLAAGPGHKGRAGGKTCIILRRAATSHGDAAGRQTAGPATDHIHTGPVLPGAKLGCRAVIPDLAVHRPGQIARRRGQPQSLLHLGPPRRPVQRQRLGEHRAIRADLDREIIAARRAHLGPARKPGLEHHRRRIGRGRLVDLQLMPRPGMVEQDGGRRHRQAVGGIRAG